MINQIVNSMYRMLGFKTTIIQVLDNITFANSKQKMILAIFYLHSKYYDSVNFDILFFNILDPLITIEVNEYFGNYMDISAQIFLDHEITPDVLREVLLQWICNEPIFKRQIMNEIPQAVVEDAHPPVADVSFV